MKLTVTVPATTANVGAGFDCVGIALDWYDTLTLEVTSEPGLQINVTGEGAADVPLDESHLVIATLKRGLKEWGGTLPSGLRLESHNTIPHSRGLGSSAAAIVAGLAFAWGLARPAEPLDAAEVGRVSSLLEGHPDNAGAASLGGGVLGWMNPPEVTIHQLKLHPELTCAVWIPDFEVPTAGARSILPDTVPRLDAVHQAIAAATLPLALTHNPDYLLAATRDRIHQDYRAGLMEPSYALMGQLRRQRIAAAISGAGPAVFAVGREAEIAAATQFPALGFRVFPLAVGNGVTLNVTS